MSETAIQQQIQMAASRDGHRLMRNNNGAFKDAAGRWVRFGLAIGASDLIGWHRDGRFLAVEVKAPGAYTDKERLESQTRFIDAVKSAGGLAGFAESVEQARAIWAS